MKVGVRGLSPAVLVAAACSRATGAPALVIQHVSVVDVAEGRSRPDLSVVITGGRITAVGRGSEVRVPRGAALVDGAGKYLIPGLWDMHVHLSQMGEAALGVLAANGITGVRDMGGDFREIAAWRRRIREGSLVGPRIVAAGPRLDGVPAKPVVDRWVIASTAEAIRAVDSLAAMKVDFIKVYEGVPRDAFFALARAARAKGLVFAGHVPAGVSAAEASDSGQKSIEHIGFLPRTCLVMFDPQAIAAHVPVPSICRGEGLDSLFRRLVHNGTWLVPTVVSFRGFVVAADSGAAPDSGLQYVPPSLRARWKEQLAGFPKWPLATWRSLYQQVETLTAAMRRDGALILAGTDLGNPYVYPGRSLHDELASLVEAGYSPAAALRAATLDPARYLGLADSLGTIAVGHAADLILLDADPVAEIHNTRRIGGVILGGRLLRRGALDSLQLLGRNR